MMAHFSAPPLSADDLLVLLAVARSGRFTTAGQRLGLNHTTIARRIAALEAQLGGRVLSRDGGSWEVTPLGTRALAAAEAVEQALGGLDDGGGDRIEGLIRLSATDGFSGFVAAPAMAALQQRHPGIALEIVTGTRQASQQRGAADLEVVVGRPQAHRAKAVHLADYALGLYASRDFLRRHPTPTSPDDLVGQPLVYFIESMLHVDSLDDARRVVPGMTDAVASTNVYVHVDATRAAPGSDCFRSSWPISTTISCACCRSGSSSACPTGSSRGPTPCSSAPSPPSWKPCTSASTTCGACWSARPDPRASRRLRVPPCRRVAEFPRRRVHGIPPSAREIHADNPCTRRLNAKSTRDTTTPGAATPPSVTECTGTHRMHGNSTPTTRALVDCTRSRRTRREITRGPGQAGSMRRMLAPQAASAASRGK